MVHVEAVYERLFSGRMCGFQKQHGGITEYIISQTALYNLLCKHGKLLCLRA